jgi:hypothetical protein
MHCYICRALTGIVKRLSVLTFDYEIFFDGQNDLEHLITKTQKLTDIANHQSVPLSFFIDIAYLEALKRCGFEPEYKRIKDQLNWLSTCGHELQFHWHPHWVTSSWNSDENCWNFNKSDYSWNGFVQNHGINKMIEAINECLAIFKYEFNIVPCAFRMGGLAIEEPQHYLKTIEELGFTIESSIFPGFFKECKFFTTDHRKHPEKTHWKIDSTTGCFKENQQGSILELPISQAITKELDFIKKASLSLNYRWLKWSSQEEEGAGAQSPMNLGVKKEILPRTASLDKADRATKMLFRSVTEQIWENGADFVIWLNHPKSLNLYSWSALRDYIDWVKNNGGQLITIESLKNKL